MVCDRWSDIILNCKGLFVDYESWSEYHQDIQMSWTNWPDAHIQFDAFGPPMDLMQSQQANERATLLVKDGFLRYAKVLWISNWAPKDVIFLIRDYAQGSGVTKFKLEIDPSIGTAEHWTDEHWNALIDVMRQSKPKSVYIKFTISDDHDAFWFWSFFMRLCHVCVDTLDWVYFDLEEAKFGEVDWSFIGNRFIGLDYTFNTVPISKLCICFQKPPFNTAVQSEDDYFNYDGLNKSKVFDFLTEVQGISCISSLMRFIISSNRVFRRSHRASSKHKIKSRIYNQFRRICGFPNRRRVES